MASQQENAAFAFLPSVVCDAKGTLASKSKSQQTWSSYLREQIDHSIRTCGRPSRTDIDQLYRKVVKLIVIALQPNAHSQAWQDLISALALIEPYSNFLNVSRGQALQIQHYVQRLYQYIIFQKKMSWEFGEPLLDRLRKVFPEELALVEEKFTSISSENSFYGEEPLEIKSIITPQQKVNKENPGNLIPSSHPWDIRSFHAPMKSPEVQEVNFSPKPLTFGDLRQSFSAVSMQASAQESIFMRSIGPEDTTVSYKYMADTPSYVQSAVPSIKVSSEPKTLRIMNRKPISQEDFNFSGISGREAVQLFTTNRHLNIVRFMYFNFTKTRHFRPYDLISAPEDEVDPEHFIFSSFGVLHVHPDGSTSETMSLAEWNRMAVLWGIIHQINFFKNFLILKSLKRWSSITRRQRLMRTRTYLENNLLHVVPEFGLSLVHVMRLVSEILEVRLLPSEYSNIRDQPLAAFSVAVTKKENEVKKLFESFFSLCRRVVTATRQECLDQLTHCEQQVQYQKNVFTKESIYLQRKKTVVRRMNYKKARHAVEQLSAFTSLVNCIISIHLLDAAQKSVYSYVYGVLCPQDPVDGSTPTNAGNSMSPNLSKGYAHTNSTKDESSKHSQQIKSEKSVFVAKLEFHSKHHYLVMQPSPEKFRTIVSSCIPNLFSILCEKMASSKDRRKISGNQGRSSVVPPFDGTPSFNSSDSFSDSFSSGVDNRHFATDTRGEMTADVGDLSEMFPDKEQDSSEIATPNLIVTPEPNFGLLVTGQAILDFQSPANHLKLKDSLNTDSKILQALEAQNNAIDQALLEVSEFCKEKNKWIASIKEFVNHWHQDNLNHWKEQPARDIENMLKKIKTWSDKVKSMDRKYMCKNKLLLVDCRVPQMELVSSLSTIFKQLVSSITANVKELSLSVTTTSKEAIRVLENKDTTIKSFAGYARKVIECHQIKEVLAQKVEYIRELYEVVRMMYRQLTHDEQKLEDKVKSTWETFVFQLKDASNFVSNQQPVILKQLGEVYKEKYAYAKSLSESASYSGVLELNKQPLEVISDLGNIYSKFNSAKRQLHELSSWREAIEGEQFDMSELSDLASIMEARLEMWKSVNFCQQAMHEWKNTQFRKFDVQPAIDTISEWKVSSMKFKEILGSFDPVLQNWYQVLSNYEMELPLLHKMSDRAMKGRHWKQIFTALGQNYEAGWAFTVKDILSYNLSQHADLVNQVCHRAIAEYNLEQILKNIKEKWESKQFNLAKHIHLVQTEVEENTTTSKEAIGGRDKKGSRRRDLKLYKSFSTTRSTIQEVDSETYVLVDSKNLLAELSNSQVTLQSMLQSRHASEIRVEAEIWSDTLKQIAEIIDLWTSCQDKWMYLSMVCHGSNLSGFPEQAPLFDNMDRRYKEFVKAVANDPKVLSMLSRRHGQPGWRELQGENLRKHIQSCIRMQEELLFYISDLLEDYRSDFPRLYFLCDEDCIRLLAISQQPKAFSPYVRKCFTSIESLFYGNECSSIATLDQELNSHKLQVIKVQGKNGEFIEFIDPIIMRSDAISWMKSFELKVAESLKYSLVKLIRHRNAGLSLNPQTLLEEISETPMSFESEHWLLKCPVQIIVLYGSIAWTREVSGDLSTNKKFCSILTSLTENIEQYSCVLRNCSKFVNSNHHIKIYSTASVVIAQTMYMRDVVQEFQNHSISSPSSFEWQRIIKHTMVIPSQEVDFRMMSKPVNEINCFVEHMGARLAKYGFEYDCSHLDGENSHLGVPFAMTSLSDRFLFALCMAYDLGRCGTLFGPESTGKSSLVMQIARIFGRQLINVDCSNQLGIPILLRALCGMVESAGFLCFDQAHTLPNNILSCLIQNIRNIQLAFSMLTRTTRSYCCMQPKSDSFNAKLTKRSNSVPSLHSLDETEKLFESKPSKWKPGIDKFQLSRFHSHEEDNNKTLYSSKLTSDRGNSESIMFNGRLLSVKSRFGVFMTFRCRNPSAPKIPESLKLIYRPIVFIKPEIQKIAEIWLRANGFLDAEDLAAKISLSANMLKGICDCKSTSKNCMAILKTPDITLNDVRSIVMEAASLHFRAKEPHGTVFSDASALLYSEKIFTGQAISQIMSQKFVSDAATRSFQNSLQQLFLCCERHPSENENQLLNSAHHELVLNGLNSCHNMTSKMIELNCALKANKGVLLIGPSGCGKTTICRTLAQVLNSIASEDGYPHVIGRERSRFVSDSSQIPPGDGTLAASKGVKKCVDICTIYPNVLSSQDLFGCFEDSTSGVWMQGVLYKILHDYTDGVSYVNGVQKDSSQAQEIKRLRKWIVLDGEVTASWIENISSMLDINKSFRLPNLDRIEIPNKTNMIFEATDLTDASPALISRCGIVHCGENNVWKYILSSWFDTAYGKYAVTRKIIEVWRDMIDDLFPKTLKFIYCIDQNILNQGIMSGKQLDSSFGVHEVTSFIHILSSLLDLHMERNSSARVEQISPQAPRPFSEQTLVSESSSEPVVNSIKSRLDDEVPESHYQLSLNLFGFAFVWACGGKLLADDMSQFDVFFRNLLNEARHEILFPIYENVFEYFVDVESGQFTLWEDKIDVRPNAPPRGTYYSYVHHVERYAYISNILLKSGNPVLIMGKPGCGKSSMVSNILQTENEMAHIAVSSGMTPWHLQKLIESHSLPHLKQHNIGLMAHPRAVIDTRSDRKQRALFFLDDISTAENVADMKESQHAIQPLHELIRQVLCEGCLYNKEHMMVQSLEGKINFLAVSTTPGALGSGLSYSTQLMSPRFVRLFSVMHFLEPSKDTILSIYHNAVQSWLEEFPAYALTRHYELSQAIIAGAVEVYASVSSHFKPSPRQPTYVFSLHDVSHVMKGLFLLAPRARGRPKPIRRRAVVLNTKEDNSQPLLRQRPMAGRLRGRHQNKEWGDPAFGSDFPMLRTIIRLWLHECSRTFCDRMTNNSDRRWFSALLVQMLKKHFCTAQEKEYSASSKTESSTMEEIPRPSAANSSNSSSDRMSSATTSDESNSEAGYVKNTTMDNSENSALKEADADVNDAENNTQFDTLEHSQFLEDEEGDVVNVTTPSLDVTDDRFSSNDETTSESSVIINSSFEQNDDLGQDDTSSEADDIGTENSQSAASTILRIESDAIDQPVQIGLTSEREDTVSGSNADGQATTTESHSFISESTATEMRANLELVDSPRMIDPSTGLALNPGTKRISHVRPRGAKHGVTFVPGLIIDPEQRATVSGPLANFDQILSKNEDPTSILFCKNILTGYNAGPEEYCEGTAEELAIALHQAQIKYNVKSSIPLELVFFQQAVEHVARLSRALSMSNGGHALCLSSMKFSGRKSLISLASSLCKASLVGGAVKEKVSMDRDERKEKLKRLVGEACSSAGIKNQSTVLVVDEILTTDFNCLANICALVKNGHYPSLYSRDELAKLATEMSTSGSFITKDQLHHRDSSTDKIDIYLQIFYKRILTNLHVVLLMRFVSLEGAQDLFSSNGTSESSYFHHSHELKYLHIAFKRCPELLTRFLCINFFQPWNHQAWITVSQKFLLDFAVPEESNNSPRIPWSTIVPEEEQILNVSHMASYIHQDVFKRVQASFPKSCDRLVTPISLRTMVNTFTRIAIKTGRENLKLLLRYEHVLAKIKQAEGDLQRYSLGKEGLLPLLHDAMETERSWKKHVEQERKEFAEAKERCDFEEEVIERLDEDLAYFRRDAKIAFDELNPLYNVAMEAMHAMTAYQIEELKRYQKPPVGAKVVVKVLCDLFEVKPATWNNGKALLLKENFFEELEFFDKDNIPDHIYQTLGKNIKDPEFQPHQVGKSSKAAESLCVWIHAIHSYAKLSRILAPKIAKLKLAESKLRKAQATLGEKRVRCNQIKEELEVKVQQHKEACASVKQYQEDLEDLDSKMTKAQTLMGNLAEYISQWRQKHNTISSRLNSAVGDSLLAAACVTYHSLLSKDEKESSLQKWREACQQRYIRKGSSEISPVDAVQSRSNRPFMHIHDKFDMTKMLLHKEVHQNWEKIGLPKDFSTRSAVTSLIALASHQESSWPLIFDPDGELHIWMTEISRLYHECSTSTSKGIKNCPSLHSEQIRTLQLDDEETLLNQKGNCDESFSNTPDGRTARNTDVLPVHVIICEADSVTLNQKLEEAVQNGLVIFVTHLERAEFAVLHRLLLLRYEILQHQNEENQLSIHKDFRMFFSTSIALRHMSAEDLRHLPLERCCCVDFSLDPDGLEQKIISHLLAREKPDFENHHRLLEADIFHLGQQCRSLQMNLLIKVSSIENSILLDPSLLEAVRLCKQETNAARTTLSETKKMEFNLMQRTVDLSDVAKYCKILHNAVLQTSVLRGDLYYWTASSFLTLFCSTLKPAVRGKSSSNLNSPGGFSQKSRAAELNRNILISVLQVTKGFMYENDYPAFVAVVSLAQLQFEDKITADEIFSLIFGIEKKVASSGKPKVVDMLEKPSWMTENVWEDIHYLESIHPAFEGILNSLKYREDLWKEYLEAIPVLQANVPFDNLTSMGNGQKALLWKTLRPDRSDQVILKLTSCVLGNMGTEQLQLRVKDLLDKTDKRNPITFLISEQGSGVTPSIALLNEAKFLKIPTVERSSPLSADLVKIFQKCVANGYWLILHECDLQDGWPKEILPEISSLCEAMFSQSHDGTDERNFKNVADDSSSLTLSLVKSEDALHSLEGLDKNLEITLIDEVKVPRLSVHQSFRLWIIMKQNAVTSRKTILPEILIRNGTIVNLCRPNQTDNLARHYFKLLSQEQSTFFKHQCMDLSDLEMSRCKEASVDCVVKIQLSLLHAVLTKSSIFLHQSFIPAMIETYYLYQRLSVTDKPHCKRELCEELTNIPSLSQRHEKILRLVIKECLNKSVTNVDEKMFEENFEEIFNSAMASIPCMKLLLEGELQNNDGEQLLQKLQTIYRCSGSSVSAVHGISTMNDSILSTGEASLEKRLEDIYSYTDVFQAETLEAVERSGSISAFFQSEWLRQVGAVKLIRKDVHCCICAVRGEIEMSSTVLAILEDLKQNKLPKIWTTTHSEIFHFYSDMSAFSFLKHLLIMTSSFSPYKDHFLPSSNTNQSNIEIHPHYNFASFLRPDFFLKSLLAEFKQPKLKVEILSKSKPSNDREKTEFVIIEGLQLHGAMFDPRSQTLQRCPTFGVVKCLPPIRLTPVTKESADSSGKDKGRIFSCPLFHHAVKEGDALLNIPMLYKDDLDALQLMDVFASVHS